MAPLRLSPLPGFLSLPSGLKIEVMRSYQYDDLVAEGADPAFRLGNQSDSAFLTRKLASTARIVVASPEYLRRQSIPMLIVELGDRDCLGGPAAAAREVWTFRRGGKREDLRVDVRVRAAPARASSLAPPQGLGSNSSSWDRKPSVCAPTARA
jgi:hypothetical protein